MIPFFLDFLLTKTSQKKRIDKTINIAKKKSKSLNKPVLYLRTEILVYY